MVTYTLSPVSDPDQLGYVVDTTFGTATDEIVIDTSAKTIALKVTGNLGTDGVTIKAVYSKLKDAWSVDTTLIRFPFPMGPITDEQFEMINGWNWDTTNTSGAATQNTVQLLRTGGWSVVNDSGNVTEQWAGIITLGSLGDSDQVYYQQVNPDTAPANFTLTGPVNQAVQIIRDDNGDSNYTDGSDFDKRTYFKIFVREWQKIYAQSEIADIGVSSLNYQAYRFPLTNAADLKVTKTEVEIDGNSDGTPDTGVYANINITYLRDANDAVYNVIGDYETTGTAYDIGDVVRDTGNSRWYKCILGYTSDATQPSSNGTNWAAYEGERLIGANYYPFTVIIDGDTTVGQSGSGAARTTEIYEAVQYFLRQNIDIDQNANGTVNGNTADSLLRFVGDNLVTSAGVYVDSFNTQDTNSITFTDGTGQTRTFPYVAAFTVNFGANLTNDANAKYWVFFTNANGNQFGTLSAIIVKDKDDVDMAGDVSARTSVSHSFNYDSNVQGGRTAGTDAAVTVVGIGLTTGQYVKATSTIARSTANTASLVAALERNYSVGTS